MIGVSHLTKIFNTKTALDDVSFNVEKTRCLAVFGESGSGKSTLARCLVGLEIPTRGEICSSGKIQLVFQDPTAALNSKFTVKELLEEPLEIHGLAVGAEQARCVELLKWCGLSEELLLRTPKELSGGQRQRVCIARALAAEPNVLICDEPTSALDVLVQAQILDLLKDLQERLKLTLIFITHDLPVARFMGTDFLVLHKGRAVEQGGAEIFARPQSDYLRRLLELVD